MIQMISGVYGGKKGMKRPGDGPFSLSAEEEKRLISREVAKPVGGELKSAKSSKGKTPNEPPKISADEPPEISAADPVV